MSLDDARIKMEDWRRDYNEFRPHSAIGNMPISLMNGLNGIPAALSLKTRKIPACGTNSRNSSKPGKFQLVAQNRVHLKTLEQTQTG